MTDSKSSMEKLATGPENQDSDCGIKIWKCLYKIKHTTFLWIPPHCGVAGNKRADGAANEAAQLLQQNRPVSLDIAKAAIRREMRAKGKAFYGEHETTRKMAKENHGRNRREEVTTNQFRTGSHHSVRPPSLG